jgi:S1-C subfamily serine protease
MNTKLLLCGLLMGVLGLATGELRAQSFQPKVIGAGPPGGGGYVEPPSPKLGVMIDNGYDYVEVVEVFQGTPASRLGLEAGDRIVEINGRPCRDTRELGYLLRLAVHENRGQIRVVIDNVRARYGEPGAERFVHRRTWLDGYEAYRFDDRPPQYKSGSGGW